MTADNGISRNQGSQLTRLIHPKTSVVEHKGLSDTRLDFGSQSAVAASLDQPDSFIRLSDR